MVPFLWGGRGVITKMVVVALWGECKAWCSWKCCRGCLIKVVMLVVTVCCCTDGPLFIYFF